MYYHLIYHVQDAVEQDSSINDDYKTYHFKRHLAYDITSGNLRKYSEEIYFAITRDDFRGFEVIVAYPDYLIPDKAVLYAILWEQEAIFDYRFSEKPTCYDNVHLHQISTLEFLMRLSQSKSPVFNVMDLIREPQTQYYEEKKRQYKAAIEKLYKKESNDSEKENHVL